MREVGGESKEEESRCLEAVKVPNGDGTRGGGGGKGRRVGREKEGGGSVEAAFRRKRPSLLLENLSLCQEAWSPGAPWDKDGVLSALWGRPAGSFLVLTDSSSRSLLLCVSSGGDVLKFPVQHPGTVYQLSQSSLGFSNLSELVYFYSLSRDVLPVCLSIPPWVHSLRELPPTLVSQLGPRSWLCLTSDLQPGHMMQSAHGKVMCSIQVTSANGALCVINPLYLQEHGYDWLTQPPISSRERHLSTMQPLGEATLNPKRAISSDQDCCSVSFKVTESTRGLSFDSALPLIHPHSPQPPQPKNLTQSSPPPLPPKSKHYHPNPQSPNSPQPTNLTQPSPPPLPSKSKHYHPNPQSPNSPQPTLPPSPLHKEVVLRRTSQEPLSLPLSRVGSQPNPGTPRPPGPSPAPQSPHRVSWVEEGAWFPPLLQPYSMRPISLSVSSLEDEPDTVISPAHSHPSKHRLAEKVKNRFSAVGQAIGGLLCPKTRITNRVQELSERRDGVFAKAVKGFVERTQRGMVMPGVTGAQLLQEVRASLTALREKLLDCQEMMTLLDSMIDTPDSEMDIMIEISLHKVALKPVSSHLYTCLQESRSQDGSLGHLLDNQGVLRSRRVEELEGAVGAGLPDIPTLEKIQQCWASMHTAYSPNKKINCLLKVCKTIYSSMTANASPGVVFGADDFLPCLTWVVLRSDVITLQLDTDYMMELLDPIQLQGQGGYYLTTLYASLFYISSFCPRLAVRQFSAEAQQSIKQWHRRRTLDCRETCLRKSRRTNLRSGQTGRGGTTSETTPRGREGDVVVSLQEAPSRGEKESLQAVSDPSPLREQGLEAEDQSGSGDVDTQAPPSTEDEEGYRQPMEKEYGVEGVEGCSQRAVEGGSDEPET